MKLQNAEVSSQEPEASRTKAQSLKAREMMGALAG